MNLAINSSLTTAPFFTELGSYLDLYIASGDAAADTVSTYGAQLKLYLNWCKKRKIEPAAVREKTIMEYRRYLVLRKYSTATIALKLTVVRRLYAAAVEQGLMATNPAARIKPPRERKDPAEHNNYLELAQARKLVEMLPKDRSLVGLRDRLLVSLMLLQGCRQIELYRLNVGDIIRRGKKVGLRVKGKGSIRVIPLKKDVAKLLGSYLKARKEAGEKLTPSTPMFISVARNSSGDRLSRRSMQRIANKYLSAAELKDNNERTVTTHGLRHTAGTLSYRQGSSLRQVQDFLGHADPRTTAIYAHIVDLWRTNPAPNLGIAV